ncbi:hypothetical protein BX600DRAFT_446620 [Xylariales sp. PMI_506]|nr:hypothetical protein BX600DRAFT_446620 [Xylariales sp. PMI_506]
MDNSIPLPAMMTSKNNSNFGEEADLRSKLAQATSTHSGRPDSAPKDSRLGTLPHPSTQSLSQPHGYGQTGIELQSHLHHQLRAASSIATAPDIMPPGPVGAGPPTSTAAAMAVQGLLDHDPHDPDNSISDGRKAKRELSQSKRAAQNRAAQRAFRQRKEHYIKKLEQQVREFGELEHNYKAIQNDNYALREYIIQLQSRLLDLQVELPQPPPNVSIPPPAPSSRPALPPPPAINGSTSESGPGTTSAGTLADVAAAVAGLRAREASALVDGYSKFRAENEGITRTDDEVRRLREPLPPPSSLRA